MQPNFPRLLLIAVLAGSGVLLGPVAAALAASAKGVAARHAEADQAWRASAILALKRRADAASLATAAALTNWNAKSDPAALELAAQAAALAPTDPAIAWIEVRVCATTPGCDIRDKATALRWLDPDNAAAWLPTLAGAEKDRNAVEVDRVLADMAQGLRFDIYWNRIVVLMYDALQAVSAGLPKQGADSDAARLKYVSGLAGAELVPPMLPLIEACRESTAGSGRRESCLKVAKNLQQGDTILAQMAGLNLERRLTPPDSREFHALAERRRVLEWRIMTADRFEEPLLPWLRNAHAHWRVSRMRALRREEDVVLAILRKQGKAVDPPDARP